jgi:hypothetical protein
VVEEKEREEDVQKWWVPTSNWALVVTEFFSPSVFGSWVFLGYIQVEKI